MRSNQGGTGRPTSHLVLLARSQSLDKAVLRAREMVEDNGSVGEVLCHLVATILEGVCQGKLHLHTIQPLNRIEARETLSREYFVAGGVFGMEQEADLCRYRGFEADVATLIKGE